MDPTLIDIVLDFFSYRAHKARVLIVAAVCLLVAFLTGFSFPWGATFLFVGIGALLWLTTFRAYGLIGIGVLLALLWGAQLKPDLFADSGASQKAVAAKSAKQKTSKAGEAPAADQAVKQKGANQEKNHAKQQGKGTKKTACDKGKKCQPQKQAQASPSLIGSARPLLGAVLLFVIIIGVIGFMLRSSGRETRGFVKGGGS